MKSANFKHIDNFFNGSLIETARKFGYSIENILILEMNEIKLKSDFPETYNNLLTCEHQRDNRSIMEYAQDLVCSWVFEDFLISSLRMNGLEVELVGEDRTRKILRSAKVSAHSDFLLKSRNKKLYIELANDYSGYWIRKLQVDLRDDKYMKLKSKIAKSCGSVLLGIDFKNRKYFIHDLSEKANVKYIEFHYPYSKPAYSIELSNNSFFDFSFQAICEDLLKRFDEFD